MNDYVAGFKALSDLTRLRAMRMIMLTGGPICVCELADALGLPQYQVSKHLAILRQVRLVSDSRIGTWVYYSIPDESTDFTADLRELVKDGVTGDVFDEDARRLKDRLDLREEGRCVLGPTRIREVRR